MNDLEILMTNKNIEIEQLERQVEKLEQQLKEAEKKYEDILNQFGEERADYNKCLLQLKEARSLLRTVLDDEYDLFDIEKYLDKR